MSEMKLSDDSVLPFEVKPLGIRGRIVRLGPVIDEIIGKHDYPENVSQVLGQAVALVAMLGNSLKFEGKLTLQTRCDGPLSMLVVDYTTPGKMRGYAHFDRETVGQAKDAGDLIGSGHLALTIDQGEDMDNYQGIVALDGRASGDNVLADAADHYFKQSEQIPTSLRIAAGLLTNETGQTWRAGAIMVQHVPDSGPASPIGFSSGEMPDGDMPEGDRPDVAEDDNWAKARLLLETTEPHELLDPLLEPERLLYRLYHEDGVTVYPSSQINHQCTCSKERVLDMLASFSDQEKADMVVDGQIEVVCQFCSNTHRFGPEEV